MQTIKVWAYHLTAKLFLELGIFTCDDNQILPTSQIDLNMGFSRYLAQLILSKRVKLKLNFPNQIVMDAPASVSSRREIEEERQVAIQACIVRIMKKEQRMKHAALLQQVIEATKGRFIPETLAFKRSIEILLENQFLDRDEHEKDTYVYVA